MVSSIVAAVAAAGTLVAANADYAPAHRGFVKHQVSEVVDAKLKVLEERVGRGESRQSAAQLQINTLRRDTLEKEKFDLNLRLKAADDDTRRLIEQRLRQINDDLGDVVQERTQIRIQQ